MFLWLTFTCTKRSNWNCCYCRCLCCCCCWVHVSWITPASPRGPVVLPATLHINACECLRPSMAALLPPCVHLHQILINMHCVLSFLSPPAWPSLPSSLPPFLPSSPPPPLPPSPPFCMMYTLNPPSLFYHHLLLPLFLTYPLVSPPHRHWHGCMCCCMACGPPDASSGTGRPPTTPQDRSGTLGAEEFKACLISLGFDIANDSQVPTRGYTLLVRGLTAVFFFLFAPFLPCFSFLPLPLNSWWIFLILQHPFFMDCCGVSVKIYFIPPLLYFLQWFPPLSLALHSCLWNLPSLLLLLFLLVFFVHGWPCRREQESWTLKTSKPALSPWGTTW